ncbi:MAG: hypothetical protein H6850_02890 [Alphaproteobacteria bacterium]|nr:MAG: hypothetical protein H6850_02890 [Alphaproteobacteria bacterium]
MEAELLAFTKAHDMKLDMLAQYIRILLTGSTISPSVFEIMEVLGQDVVLKRFDA